MKDLTAYKVVTPRYTEYIYVFDNRIVKTPDNLRWAYKMYVPALKEELTKQFGAKHVRITKE